MLPKEIFWRAPDYRRAGASAWQSLTLFASFVLGIVAFVERNIPFFIIVVVVEFFFLLGTRGSRRTMVVGYALTPEGIFVENEVVFFKDEVARFAMREHESLNVNPWFEMILESGRRRGSRRHMLIPHEQGFIVREYLSSVWGIKEFDYQVGVAEFFKRFLRL